MKLDLLTSQIEDEYIRENFTRLKRELEAQQILNGFWHFFELDITQIGVKVPIKHNLSFIPRDIIILSKEGDQSLYFNYADFDDKNLYITTPKPCRVRFLAGQYKDKAYGGSKRDFTFVSPPSTSLPTWFTGVSSPDPGLGTVGDFYLNTVTNEILLKTGTIFWTSQGFLMVIAPITTDITNTLVNRDGSADDNDSNNVWNRLFWPTTSQAPIFALDGTLTSVTFYTGPIQIVANRMAKIELTYDIDLNPATETLTLYSLVNGTTILKTVTKTYTFTTGILTKVEQVTA